MTPIKLISDICVKIFFRQNSSFWSPLTSLVEQGGWQIPRFGPLAVCWVQSSQVPLPQDAQSSRASISNSSSARMLGFLGYFEVLPFIRCDFRKEGKVLIFSVSFLAYIMTIFSLPTYEQPEQKVTLINLEIFTSVRYFLVKNKLKLS